MDCLCLAGAEPDPTAANKCRLCPLGTYKPDDSDHNCTACPAMLTTEKTVSTNASSLAWAPGRGYTEGRERVLFIGTQFSILYTFVYSPA